MDNSLELMLYIGVCSYFAFVLFRVVFLRFHMRREMAVSAYFFSFKLYLLRLSCVFFQRASYIFYSEFNLVQNPEVTRGRVLEIKFMQIGGESNG